MHTNDWMLEHTYIHVTDGPPGEQKVQMGAVPQQIWYLTISKACESTVALDTFDTDPEKKSAHLVTDRVLLRYHSMDHGYVSTPLETPQVLRRAREKARESPKAPNSKGRLMKRLQAKHAERKGAFTTTGPSTAPLMAKIDWATSAATHANSASPAKISPTSSAHTYAASIQMQSTFTPLQLQCSWLLHFYVDFLVGGVGGGSWNGGNAGITAVHLLIC